MSSLSNPSQLICRNFNLFQDCPTLMVEAPADALATEWRQHFTHSCDLFTTDYVCHRHHQHQGGEGLRMFSHQLPRNDTSYQQAILFWPKSKALGEYLLQQLSAVLAPGADVWLVGENRGGVRSGMKLMPQGMSEAIKQDTARRCSLFHAELTQPQPYPEESLAQHWFALNINGTEMQVCSYPGVFNHGELDPGTRLLLAQEQPELGGKLLDIGCGAGIIACYFGLQQPSTDLTLCDVNAMALAASQQTLKANGLTGNVTASDVFSDISGQFDLILSNPPFHQGLDTNYDITRRLVQGARSHLLKPGVLRIVANSFLKYPEILRGSFSSPQTLADDKRFRVYQASL